MSRESIFAVILLLSSGLCACKNHPFTSLNRTEVDTLPYHLLIRPPERFIVSNEDSVNIVDYPIADPKGLGYHIPITVYYRDSSYEAYAAFDTGAAVCVTPYRKDIDTADHPRYEVIGIYGDHFKACPALVARVDLGSRALETKKLFFHFDKCEIHIIGGNLLREFAWKIDNTSHIICFSDRPDSFDCSDSTAGIPFKIKDNRPALECLVNGTAHDFFLDTGASIFANLPKEEAPSEPADPVFAIGNLRIGSLSFDNEAFSTAYYDFLLGMDFFMRFDYVIFDYPNRRLILGPRQKYRSFLYGVTLLSEKEAGRNTFDQVPFPDTLFTYGFIPPYPRLFSTLEVRSRGQGEMLLFPVKNLND